MSTRSPFPRRDTQAQSRRAVESGREYFFFFLSSAPNAEIVRALVRHEVWVRFEEVSWRVRDVREEDTVGGFLDGLIGLSSGMCSRLC